MLNRILVTFLAILLSTHIFCQEINYPDSFDQPMKLFPEAMGDFHFAISSSSEEAQQYFDQGFQLMYAVAKADAA